MNQEILETDELSEYTELECINDNNLLETAENLRRIMNSVSNLDDFFEDPIKIHFPDNLTMKYNNKNLDEPINFRVLVRKLLKRIIEFDDLPMSTISAQSNLKFRFFTKDYELLVDPPKHLKNPIGSIAGIDIDE